MELKWRCKGSQICARAPLDHIVREEGIGTAIPDSTSRRIRGSRGIIHGGTFEGYARLFDIRLTCFNPLLGSIFQIGSLV